MLRYANCGHLPGLLLRRTGEVERLHSTAPVLGLLTEWDCLTGERQLLPGDVLAIYTDGITESFDSRDEEFGETRLSDALLRHQSLAPSQMIKAVLDVVRQFSPREQRDDLTLIIAKCQQ